jgi:hypothetical protein
VAAILVEGPNRRKYFWKRTIQWLFHQHLVLTEQWFQTRRFLWEFPIGSYVKLSSAVAAILVGCLKCWTQFWKGTTQGSFQQSLVEIGSVVSEEKISFKFHPLFFSIFSLVVILVGSQDHQTQFGRGPSKDHSTNVWLQLTLWFLRRRFLCEFPIGPYVKLSSAVSPILVEGPNRRTHFWKRTHPMTFSSTFSSYYQMVSDKKIFMGISHMVLC